MKALNDSEWRTGSNAGGRDSKAAHQDFEVEESDVGKTRNHMGGFNYREHTFKRSDVGRTIHVMRDTTGWTCWTFDLKPKENQDAHSS